RQQLSLNVEERVVGGAVGGVLVRVFRRVADARGVDDKVHVQEPGGIREIGKGGVGAEGGSRRPLAVRVAQDGIAERAGAVNKLGARFDGRRRIEHAQDLDLRGVEKEADVARFEAQHVGQVYRDVHNIAGRVGAVEPTVPTGEGIGRAGS